MSITGEAGFDLLDKNELKVVGVHLDGADLNALALVASEVLDLDPVEVLVTDYLDDVITFDILRRTIYPHQLLNRGDALLERLGQQDGVELAPDATVESRGMLGWIAADEEDLAGALAAAQARADDLLARIAKRVMIFSTGGELVSGEVKDTNAATISEALTADGYACDHGGALRDDVDLIAGAIRTAVGNGYGLVITTGGVGAEAKDRTVEAVLKLDPTALTPYVCRFEIDHGRHEKDGIRIAVGHHEQALIVSLPGPNDEVRRAISALRDGLRDAVPPATLASAIATELRDVLRERMHDGHGPDHAHLA
jgi:molybdenum cofactor synthesis domain-containing protein